MSIPKDRHRRRARRRSEWRKVRMAKLGLMRRGSGLSITSVSSGSQYDVTFAYVVSFAVNKGDGTSIDHARILVPSGEGDTECGCCFGDDEQVRLLARENCVLPSDWLSFQAFMVQCSDGHNFCRECIRKMTEVAVGAQTAVSPRHPVPRLLLTLCTLHLERLLSPYRRMSSQVPRPRSQESVADQAVQHLLRYHPA